MFLSKQTISWYSNKKNEFNAQKMKTRLILYFSSNPMVPYWFLATLFFILWFLRIMEWETVNCLFENMFPGLCKSFVLTPLMSPFRVLFDFDFPNWAVSHRSILELILELRLIQRGKREKMINWPWIFFLVPMVTVNIHIQTHLVWLTKF